jgi:DNA-binding NtrC family response regulator
VDDDAHIRQALVERFQARKFEVLSAGSGKEALTRIGRDIARTGARAGGPVASRGSRARR